MSDVLIKVRGVAFVFAGEAALFRDVNFTLHAGERVALLGGNGAGKSTLLRLIMGLARPVQGSVTLFGRECRSERDFVEARARLGFLFQDADDQLFCPTVADDVAFGPLNLGLSPEAAHERVHETLNALGLEHLEHRISYTLSGGEKKLAALASVLAMKPSALLLDEPTAGLSEESSAQLAGILKKLDLPCLIASHDRPFFARLVERSLFLKDGRLCESD